MDYSKLLELSQEYCDKLGFSIFPVHGIDNGKCTCNKVDCKSQGKHPLTAHGVKDAKRDNSAIILFLKSQPNLNIALACGEASGVCVIDVDDIGLLPSLESQYGTLPHTWTVATGKGKHLYFKYDERWKNVKNAVKFAGALDCRVSGAYVLLPPSNHYSGVQYRWTIAPDDCELATAPDWLIALIPKRDETKPVDNVDVNAPRSPQPTTDSNSFTIQRARNLLDRAVLYLANTPPAIAGENGHSHTYSVVCRVVELFGLLNDNEILEALDAWNERCSPPWNDSELRHKISEARKKVVTQIDTTSPDESDTDILYPTLHNDALIGIAGKIIRTIEPETEADTAAVLLTFLTVFGHIVGGNPHFKVGAGTHKVNLFTTIVGDTEAAKGEALSIAKHIFKDYLNGSLAHGLSSGEGIVERLGDNLEEGALTIPDEKRLLCVETEFSKPITAMRREGNTLSPLLRAAWDCGTLEIMTRGKSKLRATNPFVSIIAHITPDELKKLLSASVETSNGFANRFLWCLVHSTKSLPSGGNINVLDAYKHELKDVIQRAAMIREMVRSPEAETLWGEIYASLKASKPGVYGRTVERSRPIIVRLSMLYALLDCSPTIHLPHLKAAIAVWNYCDYSARLIFDNEFSKHETKLVKLITEKPGITKTELKQSSFHSIRKECFDLLLNGLIDRKRIIRIPIYEGRQADTYYPGVMHTAGIRVLGHLDVSSNNTNNTNSSTVCNETKPPNTLIPTPTLNTIEVDKPNLPNTLIPIPNVKAATLVELIDWRNQNSLWFERRGDGTIWVTKDKEPLLTPAIHNAIIENQSTVALFVKQPTIAINNDIENDPLFIQLRDMSSTIELPMNEADNASFDKMFTITNA